MLTLKNFTIAIVCGSLLAAQSAQASSSHHDQAGSGKLIRRTVHSSEFAKRAAVAQYGADATSDEARDFHARLLGEEGIVNLKRLNELSDDLQSSEASKREAAKEELAARLLGGGGGGGSSKSKALLVDVDALNNADINILSKVCTRDDKHDEAVATVKRHIASGSSSPLAVRGLNSEILAESRSLSTKRHENAVDAVAKRLAGPLIGAELLKDLDLNVLSAKGPCRRKHEEATVDLLARNIDAALNADDMNKLKRSIEVESGLLPIRRFAGGSGAVIDVETLREMKRDYASASAAKREELKQELSARLLGPIIDVDALNNLDLNILSNVVEPKTKVGISSREVQTRTPLVNVGVGLQIPGVSAGVTVGSRDVHSRSPLVNLGAGVQLPGVSAGVTVGGKRDVHSRSPLLNLGAGVQLPGVSAGVTVGGKRNVDEVKGKRAPVHRVLYIPVSIKVTKSAGSKTTKSTRADQKAGGTLVAIREVSEAYKASAKRFDPYGIATMATVNPDAEPIIEASGVNWRRKSDK